SSTTRGGMARKTLLNSYPPVLRYLRRPFLTAWVAPSSHTPDSVTTPLMVRSSQLRVTRFLNNLQLHMTTETTPFNQRYASDITMQTLASSAHWVIRRRLRTLA